MIFPSVKISLFTQESSLTVIKMIKSLFENGFWVVGIVVLFVLIISPLILLISFAILSFLLKIKKGKDLAKWLLFFISIFLPWNMNEIFLISILVALVKLIGYVQIEFDIAFWALVLFVLVDLALSKSINKKILWDLWEERFKIKKGVCYLKKSKLINCHICDEINSIDNLKCCRCGFKIRIDVSKRLLVAWSFLITAIIFYIPANMFPILESIKFGHHGANTIIGGVILLWEEGSWIIALIILVASVFIPILKFILISYILINYKKVLRGSKKVDQHKLYYLAEIMGPWSMIDVFVVSILGALVNIGHIKIVEGPGATSFVLMVIFTMLSALMIDSRFFKEPK